MRDSSVAGVASLVDLEHMSQSVHPGHAMPQRAPSKPNTVGMNRQAAMQADQEWRDQLCGRDMATPVNDAWHGQSAGMSSAFRGKASVRSHVGELDSRSAAEYNLQVVAEAIGAHICTCT